MAPLADVYARLRPDTSGFRADAEKGIKGAELGKLGTEHGKAFGSSFATGFKGVVAGLGAVFAAAGVVEFLKESIAEQRESIKVGNITNSVLKSTAGAAHVTAQQIGDLATALSLKTGVDDEAIQSGENLLLTFTKVRNEAGKGNDIFNRATGLIEDMAAAMGHGEVTADGLQSATIQVGKALNDPIKGITALTRVGVTFTEQQKEQIKHFVDSGNIMAAQKVILKELATEFGGTAAAAADPAKKAAVAWGNFKEMIGGFVLPILATLGAFLTGTILPVVQDRIVPAVQGLAAAFRSGFTDGATHLSGFAGALQGLGHALSTVWGQAKDFWVGLTQGADTDAGTMQQLGAVIKEYVIPAIGTLVGWLSQAVGWLTGGSTWAGEFRSALGGATLAILAVSAALKVWAAVQAVLDAELWANPIGLVVLAIGALVGGIIYAYTHFQTFRDIVNDTWHVIATVALWAWNNVLKPTIDALVVGYQVVATGALWLWHNVFEPAFRGIAAVATWWWDNILHPILTVVDSIIRNVIVPTVLFLWHNVWEPTFHAIAIIATTVFEIIRVAVEIGIKILTVLYTTIRDILAPAFTWFWHAVVEPIWRGISLTISAVWHDVIKPIFDGFVHIIRDVLAPAFHLAVDGIEAAWNRIVNVAKVPINFVIGFIDSGIIDPVNTIAKFFGVKDRVGRIDKLASGGRIRGPGGPRDDKIPAWLSNEEFVVNAEDTRLALPMLEWINGGGLRALRSVRPRSRYPGDLSQGIPGFADGGWVGDLWGAITNPGKTISGFVNGLLHDIPGGDMLQQIITGGAHKLVNWLVNWVTGEGGGSGTPASLGAVSNLLHSLVGTPYRWAGASPNGADCSGIVSIAYNALKGRDLFRHTFSTGDLPNGFFPLAGMGGLLTAGWSNPGESGPGGGPNGVGHMAGWLGPGPNGSTGLKFESTGSTGVRVGDSVTPISSFAHVGHFDRGGQLVPGWNLAYNGTGRGEPVGGPLELSDETIAKLGAAIGREITGVGRAMVQTARGR